MLSSKVPSLVQYRGDHLFDLLNATTCIKSLIIMKMKRLNENCDKHVVDLWMIQLSNSNNSLLTFKYFNNKNLKLNQIYIPQMNYTNIGLH